MSHFHICILYAIFTLFLNLDLLLFFGVFFVCQQLHITLAILFIVNRTCIYKYTNIEFVIIMDLYIPGSILHVHKHTLLFIIHVLNIFLQCTVHSLNITVCDIMSFFLSTNQKTGYNSSLCLTITQYLLNYLQEESYDSSYTSPILQVIERLMASNCQNSGID